MSELKRRPFVTIWGILGGPNEAPWTRSATDADLERMNFDPADYEPDRDEGHWAW